MRAKAPRRTPRRCRNEKSMIQLSMQPILHDTLPKARPGRLLVAPSAFTEVVLEQLGTKQTAALRDDDLAGQHAGDDLRDAAVAGAGPDRACVKDLEGAGRLVTLVAHEHDVAVALPLNGFGRDDDGALFLAQNDPARSERADAQRTLRIGELGTDFHRACLFIDRATDPNDLRAGFAVRSAGQELDGLSGRSLLRIAGAEQ